MLWKVLIKIAVKFGVEKTMKCYQEKIVKDIDDFYVKFASQVFRCSCYVLKKQVVDFMDDALEKILKKDFTKKIVKRF